RTPATGRSTPARWRPRRSATSWSRRSGWGCSGRWRRPARACGSRSRGRRTHRSSRSGGRRPTEPSWGNPAGAPGERRTAVNRALLAVLVPIGFSVVGVVGDYFLKLASDRDNPLKSRWFYIGFLVYASTAFGWVFVMRHLKLGTIGVVYSVSMILLLTLVGTRWFGESLNYYEMAGIGLAIVSLILLVRFA